jgi:hypothetical protein
MKHEMRKGCSKEATVGWAANVFDLGVQMGSLRRQPMASGSNIKKDQQTDHFNKCVKKAAAAIRML